MTGKSREPAATLEQALAGLKAREKAAADMASELAPELAGLSALQRELESLPQHKRRQVLDAMGLQHVSAAPSPITPLTGRGASTRTTDQEKELDAVPMPSLQGMTAGAEWVPDAHDQAVATSGAPKTPPKSKESADERCDRLLAEFERLGGAGSRGALARVVEADGRARPTVTADIKRAQKKRKENSNSIARMGRGLGG